MKIKTLKQIMEMSRKEKTSYLLKWGQNCKEISKLPLAVAHSTARQKRVELKKEFREKHPFLY